MVKEKYFFCCERGVYIGASIMDNLRLKSMISLWINDLLSTFYTYAPPFKLTLGIKLKSTTSLWKYDSIINMLHLSASA